MLHPVLEFSSTERSDACAQRPSHRRLANLQGSHAHSTRVHQQEPHCRILPNILHQQFLNDEPIRDSDLADHHPPDAAPRPQAQTDTGGLPRHAMQRQKNQQKKLNNTILSNVHFNRTHQFFSQPAITHLTVPSQMSQPTQTTRMKTAKISNALQEHSGFLLATLMFFEPHICATVCITSI
ncbi:hypothetical protein [Azospirillum griseum]|uniref:Uncharacterized protein n=1 Tax=Azospirillum griseum TaxID=2496639 RepID=A0A431VGR2_9PROT|nr:hypothetical protein [Azospirillum griseum]RTR19127.1 hypothetical protein EJ903_13900 [Azospirillum griseum]